MPVEISINWCISVPEDSLYLSKHCRPDEMWPCVAFHIGLHCLPKNNTYLTISRMKRV